MSDILNLEYALFLADSIRADGLAITGEQFRDKIREDYRAITDFLDRKIGRDELFRREDEIVEWYKGRQVFMKSFALFERVCPFFRLDSGDEIAIHKRYIRVLRTILGEDVKVGVVLIPEQSGSAFFLSVVYFGNAPEVTSDLSFLDKAGLRLVLTDDEKVRHFILRIAAQSEYINSVGFDMQYCGASDEQLA